MEDTDRNKLVIEIMALAYLVQVHTDYAVFINYSGHVDSLEISIRESAANYIKKITSTEFYVEKYRDDAFGWLKSKRDHLLSIIKTGEVDTSEINEVLETIVHYEF